MVKQNFEVLNGEKIKSVLRDSPQLANPNFLCFFSTQWMGFTIDPLHFTVPIEDHGFHRGDGVFEAVRVVEGRPYLLMPHLERMKNSAAQIKLNLPMELDKIAELCHQAALIANEKNLILRLYATRGPGSFGTSPKDCKTQQFYLAATRFVPPNEENYKKGVKIGRSQVPAKDPFFARVKSLNYLPNVLMKAESLERGLDFTIGIDPHGNFLEGSTENLVLVNKQGEMVHPPLDFILRGCTMRRTFDLAEKNNLLPVVRGRALTENDIKTAREVFMIGTTLDVLPVSEYEGQKIPLGPIAPQLREWVRQDQISS